MNNNNKYILFYSDRCPHSKEFILQLNKMQILDKFITINVLTNKVPQIIKSVPTILVPNVQDPLDGDKAFFWLENCYKGLQQQKTPQQYQRPPQQYQQKTKQDSDPNTLHCNPFLNNY